MWVALRAKLVSKQINSISLLVSPSLKDCREHLVLIFASILQTLKVRPYKIILGPTSYLEMDMIVTNKQICMSLRILLPLILADTLARCVKTRGNSSAITVRNDKLRGIVITARTITVSMQLKRVENLL